MNGYEAAVECMKTDVYAGCGLGRAYWEGTVLRWLPPDGSNVTPTELSRCDWKPERAKGPEPAQPDCPEGFELWRLWVDPTGVLNVSDGHANWDPSYLRVRFVQRFCGWRFEDGHGVYYRLDTWHSYPDSSPEDCTEEPDVVAIATHALMRKE